MTNNYVHHLIECRPRTFADVADQLRSLDWRASNGALYGVWRAQIGQPRDTLNVITTWQDGAQDTANETFFEPIANVLQVSHEPLSPTLRPATPEPPVRQGNYAFRWFELPDTNWSTFLSLCEEAWPGFEAAYDSQVIGLWQSALVGTPRARALLLTRRPDLAMWERSKKPATEAERQVRERLSRRYDLCDATWVYTTTLLSAADQEDAVRWT